MNEDITLNDHIITHCNESMDAALSAERHPFWVRSCPEISDINFVRFGLLRCIDKVDSGHNFLQTASDIHNEQLPISTYFNSLKSLRRSRRLKAIEKQSFTLHCDMLASNGIDYLQQFPELDQYTVEAAWTFYWPGLSYKKRREWESLCGRVYLFDEPKVWAAKTTWLYNQWNKAKSRNSCPSRLHRKARQRDE